MEKKDGYRFYYDKDYQYFYDEFMMSCANEKQAKRYAKEQVRMYANLYCRDVRKRLISKNSKCANCGNTENLQIDHIISVSCGGKNQHSNIQILCSKCNNLKRNK